MAAVDMEREHLISLRQNGGFFEVSGVCRYAVRGGDCLRYLNGQVSNDLRKLQPQEAMQGCLLSPKGKLEAVLQIWQESEGSGYIVEADALLAEHLGARLERYIVADDVVVEPVSVPPTIHVFGAVADSLGVLSTGMKIARLGVAGIDLPENPTKDALREGGIPEADPICLEILRIENRLPKWGAELNSVTLPAEVGLDETAVDFAKGCYLGQEVVSRLRSVGHANYQLCRVQADREADLVATTSLYAGGILDKPVGRITSLVRCPERHMWIGLALVHKRVVAEEALVALSCEGKAVPVRLWK